MDRIGSLMILREMHIIWTPAGMEVFLFTCYYLACIAGRCPALKANTHSLEECLKTVLLFFSSSPESSSRLIDGRINLCGHDARAVYFCGPGLIGGQEVTEVVLKVIVPYS